MESTSDGLRDLPSIAISLCGGLSDNREITKGTAAEPSSSREHPLVAAGGSVLKPGLLSCLQAPEGFSLARFLKARMTQRCSGPKRCCLVVGWLQAPVGHASTGDNKAAGVTGHQALLTTAGACFCQKPVLQGCPSGGGTRRWEDSLGKCCGVLEEGGLSEQVLGSLPAASGVQAWLRDELIHSAHCICHSNFPVSRASYVVRWPRDPQSMQSALPANEPGQVSWPSPAAALGGSPTFVPSSLTTETVDLLPVPT